MWTEIEKLVIEYRANANKIKALKARNDAIRPSIIKFLGKAGTYIIRGASVKYSVFITHRFDSKLLEQELPEVFAKYNREYETDRLEIK